MSDFRTQLVEDFEMYRKRYPNIANLAKDEWAFNFWVLDNLVESIKDKLSFYSLIGNVNVVDNN